jgi:hypothetical protein
MPNGRLLDRRGLSQSNVLVHMHIVGCQQFHICRYDVPCRKLDHISGYKFFYIYMDIDTVADGYCRDPHKSLKLGEQRAPSASPECNEAPTPIMIIAAIMSVATTSRVTIDTAQRHSKSTMSGLRTVSRVNARQPPCLRRVG